MPSRFLKENICRSDDIDQLTWFEEVLFYRLIVNCDDFGRFDGREIIIKNTLFPLKENLTVKTVRDAINKLASVGLVTLYEYEGKPFLYLPTWYDHQRSRATTSKYPAPDENGSIAIAKSVDSNLLTSDSNSLTSDSKLRTSADKCSRIRIRNSYSYANAQNATFDEFWQAYPRRVDKKKAFTAWNKLNPDDELVKTILGSIEKQKQSVSWTQDGGKYIPYPSTWLNERRWEDELEPVETNSLPKLEIGEDGYAHRV